MSRPSPPQGVLLRLYFRSELLDFHFLTQDIDLDAKPTMRVDHRVTKIELRKYLEAAMLQGKPKESFELFKHGREGQWGWDVYVAGRGMKDWVRLQDGVSVGHFAGDDGRGAVRVKGEICFDPDWEEYDFPPRITSSEYYASLAGKQS